MPTAKLTNRCIQAVKRQARASGKREIVIWDEVQKGFGCSVSGKGKASWLVKKRLGEGGRKARTVWHVFGNLEEINLEEARDRARTLISEIREGIDLKEVRKRTRETQHAAYKSGKLKDVFQAYYERNSQPGRYWLEVKRRFEAEIIPTLGSSKIIANVTKQDIRALIDIKEAKTKAGARLTFAALRPFFRWCVSRDLITLSPTEGLSARSSTRAREIACLAILR